MSTWRKLFAGLGLGLPLLVVAAAFLLPMLVDREQLRIDLEADISKSLMRPTSIERVGLLQLLPTPLLRLEGVRVAATPDAGPDADALAAIEQVELRAALWSLILGELRLVEVILEQPELSLSARSLQSAVGFGLTEEAGAEVGSRQASEAGAPGLPPRYLAVASVSGADALPPRERVAADTVATGQLRTVVMPPIERLVVRDGALSQRLGGGVGRLHLRALQLRAGPIVAGQAGRADANFTLHAPWSRTPLAGRLEGGFALPDPITRVALRALRLRIGADENDSEPLVDAEADALIEPARGRVVLDPLRVSAGALSILGHAVFSPTPAGIGIDGRVQVPPTDLRAWMSEHLGIELPGSIGALSRVGADFDIRLVGSALAIDNAELAIDGTAASAWARLLLPTVPDGPLAGQLAVALDRLDVGPYLPASLTASVMMPGVAGAAVERPLLPPVAESVVQPVDGLSLWLGAGELRLGELRVGAIEVDTLLQGPRLDAAATADLYGGALEATSSLRWPASGGSAGSRASSDSGSVELMLDALARGVDLGALLRDIGQNGSTQAPLTGIAELECALNAQVDGTASVARTLGGDARLEIRDGALIAVNLDRRLASALGALGISRDDMDGLRRFSVLSLTASGADGLFSSRDIALRSPLLHVDGGGRIDLPNQQVSLDLEAVLSEASDSRAIKALRGIPIPFSAEGHWADPRWHVDVRSALDAAARRALRDDGSLFDKLEERTGIKGLGDGLRQLLPGLLGR